MKRPGFGARPRAKQLRDPGPKVGRRVAASVPSGHGPLDGQQLLFLCASVCMNFLTFVVTFSYQG